MPTQPFIRPRPPGRSPSSGRPSSSVGRVVGAGLVLAGLFFGGVTAKDMGYENGHKGEAGTLTVRECRTEFDRVGSSRHRYTRPVDVCTGAFRADAGGVTVEDATVETTAKFEAGKQLAVQKTDYRFVMIDEQWVWRSLAIVCVSVCALVAGLFCLLTGFGSRRGPKFRDAWRRMPGGAAARVVLAGVGGLVVLAAGAALLVDGIV
ncbi:hypothetical protein [Streptomyces sp. NPDC017529]|uniref:hypothetical protein n=1 Tax=Streptomyces sp. NPDC017529 TaxID=3365000 RepID=UPI0037B1DE4D